MISYIRCFHIGSILKTVTNDTELRNVEHGLNLISSPRAQEVSFSINVQSNHWQPNIEKGQSRGFEAVHKSGEISSSWKWFRGDSGKMKAGADILSEVSKTFTNSKKHMKLRSKCGQVIRQRIVWDNAQNCPEIDEEDYWGRIWLNRVKFHF